MRHLIPQLYFIRVSWTLLVMVSAFCFLLLFMSSSAAYAGQSGQSAAPPPNKPPTSSRDNGQGAAGARPVRNRKPKEKPRPKESTTPKSAPTQPNNEGNTSGQGNLIDIYLSWLDDDKKIALLAFTNPSTRRVVVGIAQPSQTQDDLGSLNDIPGFKESITNAELAVFRAALAGNPQQKYKVITVGSNGPFVSFDQIDEKFRDYVRSATAKSGDLEVWDVTTVGETRVIFLGDLVVVKPVRASSSQGKAEEAMFQLLNKMALDEKKGIRKVSLQGGCAGTAATLQVVRQEPFSEELRRALRNAVTGKVTGIHGEAVNDFKVTNSGWVNSNLHLDVQPVPGSESDFQVTAVIGPIEKSILNQSDLELPPCEVARISIEPQSWYSEFSAGVDFHYDENESRLTAKVPGTMFNLLSIFAVVVAAGIGVALCVIIWLLFKYFRGPSPPTQTWSDIMGSKVGGAVTERTTLVSESPSPFLSKLKFWKKAGTSHDASKPLTAEYLDQQIDQFNKFIGEIKAALPRLDNANETQKKLVKAENELKHWQETLKDFGDSPDTIVADRKAFELNHRKVESEIETLFGLSGARHDGKDHDALQSLVMLQQEVPRLKGYETAARQIADLITVKSSETAIQREAQDVVETVKRLRGFTVKVLSKYAKRLQVESELDHFSAQSLTELEKSFASVEQAIEVLDGMEEDERIRLARLVSARIQKAGTQLDRLARTNPESRSMFDAIGMEFTVIAPQLKEASDSLNATLWRVSSRQVQRGNGTISGPLNTEEVLAAFMNKLLSDKYDPLVNMLRLWQVMEIYCPDSTDPVAAKLYVDSEAFRNTCVQILSDFKCLGIHFHQIQFLKKPEEEEELVFDEAHSMPRLQNNACLYELIQRRFLSSGLYWGTIADVAKWGFECELAPALNSRTMLWCWRKVSTGRSDESALT